MTGNGDAEASHQAAALDNTSESRMTASLVSSLGEKVTTAHPLVATQSEHLASKLVLTWNTFMMSGAKDKSLIDMMLAILEDCRVDLKYGPQTGTVVESAFFDFSSEFTRAQSDELHEEVARLNPKLRGIDPELIMAVHKALRTDADTGLEGEHRLGNILPRDALPFFLASCLELIPTSGAHEEVILKEVKKILLLYQRYSNTCPRTSPQKPADNGGATSQPVTAENFKAALLAVKSHIEASVVHANRAVESVVGQHAALLKDANMDSLMEKLGKATDIATATSLFDQVCALHAVQYAIIARTAAESNEDIIPLIDKMVQAIESSNP